MSYTTTDVLDAIGNLKGALGEGTKTFRVLLLNTEAVDLGSLGYAHFVQEQEERRGYDNEGELYYVFRVVKGDSERFFKVDGWYSSYDGATYYDRVREVKPLSQPRYTWVNA